METMRLRNGTTAPTAIVKTTTLSLKALWDKSPLAAYDLAKLARDPGYVPFGNAMQVLSDYHLVTDGEIQADVRNVVLSAFEGDGPAMRLINPATE